MRYARAAAGIAGVAVWMMASGASAQTRRPTPTASGPQFNASVYGGYDRPLFTPTANASLRPTSQTFAGADLSLNYMRPGRRVGMNGYLGLSNRYYPEFTPSTAPSYSGGLSMSSNYQGRWQWALGGFANYAPFSATSLFATATTANAQPLAVTNAAAFQQSTIRQVDVNGTASLSYAVSRRTNISVSGLAGSLVPIDSPISQVERYTAALRLSHAINRSLSGYVGYNFNHNRVAAQGSTPATSVDLSAYDFGLNFSRPIQITRSTTLGISTGVVNVPGTGGKDYRLTGAVTLDHYFGRSTWMAQLAALRDARFVQSFRNAVASNAVSLSAGGRLVGRFGTLFSTNYTSGTITGAQTADFTSYSGSATVRFDLLRKLAAFVEYTTFLSDVDGAALAGTGLPSGRFGRQAVRGGLSFGLSPFAP